jgi:hypothetical protein
MLHWMHIYNGRYYACAGLHNGYTAITDRLLQIGEEKENLKKKQRRHMGAAA